MTKIKAPKITQLWSACFEISNVKDEQELRDALRGYPGVLKISQISDHQWQVFIASSKIDVKSMSRNIIKEIKKIRENKQ